MDVTQARELYSAYYEGIIERVSATALDEAMRLSPEIREDYISFALVMDALPTLAEETVSTPHDLHDKIMQKIDLHIWETKQARKLTLFGNPKMAWFGAAAVALIVFAGIAIVQPGGGSNLQNTGPNGPAAHVDVTFEAENGSVHLRAKSVGSTYRDGMVSVKSLEGAAVKQEYVVRDGTPLNVPLANNADTPAVLGVEGLVRNKAGETHVLVLPGKVRTAQLTGEGTVTECAKAVASTFGTPVEISGDASKPCKWSFTSKDNAENLVVALGRSDITAAVADTGILRITAK